MFPYKPLYIPGLQKMDKQDIARGTEVPPLGQAADLVIMFVAGALIAFWLYRMFYRWLHSTPGSSVYLLDRGGELADDDETIVLLEASGYEVLSGKHRVPIRIALDNETLHTRLYIDYVVQKDGGTYLVKTARERMPMDWTGSGVRDRLLAYALLLPDAEGILFVDAKARTIRVISFEIGYSARRDKR